MDKYTLNVNMMNHKIVPQTAQSFNQHKFVKDIYECEKTLIILNKRITMVNEKIKTLSNSRPQFKKSSFYDNYKSEHIKCRTPEQIVDDYKKIYKVNNLERKHTTKSYMFKEVLSNFKYPTIYYKEILLTVVPGIILFALICFLTQNLVFSIALGCILDTVIFLCYVFKEYHREEKALGLEYERAIKEYSRAKCAIPKNEDSYNYWKDQYDNFSKIKNLEIDRSIEVCNKELKSLRKELQVTENTLKMLYNLRINGSLCLHPNYRGLVPISIIYGYFDTGRCFQLQGHEGAYNLYEDEKFKGIIINKLDTVSQQLGKLNRSMYYVEQAIEECNNRLTDLEITSRKTIDSVNNVNNNIGNHLTGISNKMTAIENNTANGAYYAEVAAKMTTFNTVYNLLK